MNTGEIKQQIGDAIQPNGNLFRSVEYLDWSVGDNEATLDGLFTAPELRAIADWMDSHS